MEAFGSSKAKFPVYVYDIGLLDRAYCVPLMLQVSETEYLGRMYAQTFEDEVMHRGLGPNVPRDPQMLFKVSFASGRG